MDKMQELSLDEMSMVSGGAGGDRDYITYTVVRGDTLKSIAHRYHVTEDDLVRWNHISDRNLLVVNTRLIIYL